MKAVLHLEGKADKVLSVIQLAIEEKITNNVEIDATEDSASKTRVASNGLHIGDRIQVTQNRSDYEVQIGDLGKIVDVKRAGKGKTLRIKWDDGSESPIAASIVKKVRS